MLVEWLISSSGLDLWPTVPRLRGYPVAKYFNAFDFTISAAGYNSYNEIISLGLPAIFIANDHPMLDDQVGRASFAAEAGAAFELKEARIGEIGPLIDALLDREVRFVMQTNCLRLAQTNGASQAADAIAELAGWEESQ